MPKKLIMWMGSTLEWYEFSLCSYFIIIFQNIFFNPQTNSIKSLLMTINSVCIGFVARPIGALICGYIGDRFGRMVVLKLTLPIMTIAIFAIGVLPTYNDIGILSGVLFILIRIIQGVALGGEYAGSMIYLSEFSDKNTFLKGSLGSCIGSVGILIASVIASIVYKIFPIEHIYSGAWRYPFLIAVPIAIILSTARFYCPETTKYLKVRGYNTTKLITQITQKEVKLLAISTTIISLHATSFYFTYIFLPLYLSKIRHMSIEASLINNSIFLILHICLIPLIGTLSDLFNARKILIFINTLFLISIFPVCYLINMSATYVITGICILSILTAFNAAIIPGIIMQITDTYNRFTISALSFNIGFGVIGGIAPLICMYLAHVNFEFIIYYLELIAIITSIATFIIPHHIKEISN